MLSDSMRVGLSAGAAMRSFSLRSVCDECAQKLYRYWGEESLIPSPTTESARSQEENCSLYFVPITTLKNVGGRGCKDRKSTRLNSSHVRISYAVFCLKKKTHVRHDPFFNKARTAEFVPTT